MWGAALLSLSQAVVFTVKMVISVVDIRLGFGAGKTAHWQLLKDPKVSLAVLNPYIKRTVKVKSLNDITKREKFSPLTANLMNLLAENGRLGNTQGIISAFSTIMSVHRGEVPCTVTTASPLDDAVLSELKTVLKSFLSPNQILKLEIKTDPSIMGGMIVRIGEKYVDMSAKSKIQKLSKAMREML